MAQTADQRREDTSPQTNSPYLQGWLTSRFEKGETPDYGYPPNHLPHPIVDSIDVKTGFLAGARR